jgi:hypothetical protein
MGCEPISLISVVCLVVRYKVVRELREVDCLGGQRMSVLRA